MLNAIWDTISKWGWTEWGTIATIIGTTMSIWAVCAIRSLKKIFVARQRLPEIKKRLSEKLNELGGYLVSATLLRQNIAEFQVTIRVVREVVLSYFEKSLSKNPKTKVDAIKTRCDGVSGATTHKEAFDLYSDLRGIEEQLHGEIRDLDYTH